MFISENVSVGMIKYMRLEGLQIPARDKLIRGLTGQETFPNIENPVRNGFFALSNPGLY